MLEDTRRHLQHCDWTGRGRLRREEIKALVEQHHLPYFERVGDFTDQYEGLSFFTRSIHTAAIATSSPDVPPLPLYKDDPNIHVMTDLKAALDSFGPSGLMPFYVALTGRTICPVGTWASARGHGFIILATDGRMFLTTHRSLGLVSESEFTFFDRLLTQRELYRLDPNGFYAEFDLNLFKG